MVMEIRLGDVASMRKPHPCGGFEWRVVRLGADIGIRCLKCNRRVLIPRSTFERRLKAFISRGEPAPTLRSPTPPSTEAPSGGAT